MVTTIIVMGLVLVLALIIWLIVKYGAPDDLGELILNILLFIVLLPIKIGASMIGGGGDSGGGGSGDDW